MKSTNEIHDMIQTSSTDNDRAAMGRILNIAEALLDNIKALQSYVQDCNNRIIVLTDHEKDRVPEQVVPAQWYRSAVHNHMKARVQVETLRDAIKRAEIPAACRELITATWNALLDQDAEYKQLLAEEQPTIVWGKGLEDTLEFQKIYCLALSPTKEICDLSKAHAFRHSWEEPCESTCNPAGTCEVPHGCVWANGHDGGHLFDCDPF